MNEHDENESFYRDAIDDMEAERYQLEDPMTFWNAEKKTLWKKMLGRTETPFVLMGVGLVVVIIVFFAIYPRGKDTDALPGSAEMADRLQQIEDKIAGMEATLKGLAALEQDMQPVKKAVLRLDAADASLSARLDSVDDALASLQKKMEGVAGKTSAETKPPAASTPADTTKTVPRSAYYEVQKGDTLYSIGRRYGVTVDVLRKLNGLSDQDAIQPGQELKVKDQ